MGIENKERPNPSELFPKKQPDPRVLKGLGSAATLERYVRFVADVAGKRPAVGCSPSGSRSNGVV